MQTTSAQAPSYRHNAVIAVPDIFGIERRNIRGKTFIVKFISSSS